MPSSGAVFADPVNFFTHGSQTGSRRADTGKKTNDPQQDHNPYAKVKPALKINAQHQEHASRKQT